MPIRIERIALVPLWKPTSTNACDTTSSCRTVGGVLVCVVSFIRLNYGASLYSEISDFLTIGLYTAINCDNGRVYQMCGPISDETCSGPVTAEPVRPTDLCVEGCYCPKGSALHKDHCISRSQCPCTLRQKMYQPGEQVPNDCNTWLVFARTSSQLCHEN